jgi:hypothetical protein
MMMLFQFQEWVVNRQWECWCHLSVRGHARWVSGLPKLLFCCCSAIENRGSLSLILIMKVMFWHFVSDSHKVLTALMFVLMQWCCCSGFRQTFCILVTCGVLKGYMFRVQQTPTTIIDVGLSMPQTQMLACTGTKWNEMKLIHTSLLQLDWGYYWLVWLAASVGCHPISWLSLPIASRNVTESQEANVCTTIYLKF